MSQDTTNKELFSDFAPISTEQWEEKIKVDLKGADYERKLIWKSPEGIKIKPYYRAEDIENLEYSLIKPGQFPFVRGNKTDNDWFVRQDIFVDDIQKANKKALDVLMKGVTSLGFVFSDKYEAKVSEIEQLLENIFADSVEINFVANNSSAHKIISVYESLVKKYNRNPENILGSVNFDPFSTLLFQGKYCQTESYAFEHAIQTIKAGEFLPNFRTLSVSGINLRNAGANIVEELAFTLSMGAEYITRLTDLELSVDDIAPRIKFNMGVGSNYFMEIAKLRTARILWAKIVNAYGPKNTNITKMNIHSANINFNKTIYDAHANLLRTTTETLSAVLSGTDSFTVLPYNSTSEWPTEFSERIARNQQLVLKEEAFIDKIVDPAAGSYYIENLTNELIDKVWDLFLKVDEKGGFIAAVKKGFVQDCVEKSANDRIASIANRKEIYLGTNQYPNFTEFIDKTINPDSLKAYDQTEDDAFVRTLKQFRVTQGFENLRYATDMYAKNNKRPLAYMLTIGHLNMRKARAQFACNFFAVAGFEVQDNNGFQSIAEGLKAAEAVHADIVVLCSSDDEYLSLGKEFVDNAKMIPVIAGYPKNYMDDLKALGLSRFIHVKSNLYDDLKVYQSDLGII